MNDTSELAKLYRDTILEHSRNPHHFGRLSSPDATAEGNNPLCGDRLTVYLRLQEEKIKEASFEGVGCAICMASASIMTDRISGQEVKSARSSIRMLENMLSGDQESRVEGPMAALAGVRSYPSRVRCATLPWKSLEAALEGVQATVTTED